MQAGVAEDGAVGVGSRQHCRGGHGDDDPARAVGCRAVPHGPDDAVAYVVPGTALLRLPGMHRDPHPERDTVRLRLGVEGALRTDFSGQRVARQGECCDDAVTLALLDRADAVPHLILDSAT